MIVSEVFHSIQGEGFLTGVPSVFVRLSGCPLRCRWCDTKYAWDESAGTQYAVGDVVKAVEQWPTRFVVITGGEPMVNPELPQLAKELKSSKKHITIETAGVVFVPNLSCDLMSISPKLSNSMPSEPQTAAMHEKMRFSAGVLRRFLDKYEYQLKFVVDSGEDLSEIERTLGMLGTVDHEKVMLMPQATERDELIAKSPMIAELCKRTGFIFCQRLQVLLWNNEKGR